MENTCMSDISDAFKIAFADGPSDKPDRIDKAAVRRLGPVIERRVSAASAGTVVGISLADITSKAAERDMEEGQKGEVTAGSDKGTYSWSAGMWTRVGDLIDPVALQAGISTVQGGLDDVASRVPEVEANPYTVPLFYNEIEQVFFWTSEDGIDAFAMSEHLRKMAVADVASEVGLSGDNIPLFRAGDRVLIWIDAEGLHVAGDESSGDISQNTNVPLATDGRSLNMFRNKVGRIAAGSAAKLKVAWTGDSWSEIRTIPQAMIDLLTSKVAPAASSFVQANKNDQWAGENSLVASAEWTRQDVSENAEPLWPYGTGPDGQNYYTAAASATITIESIPGIELRIYTRKYGGTFRYRVDNAATWTVVTEGNGGGLTVTTISGLSDTTHKLEIDTTGNTGVVNFCGIYNIRSQKIEVIKMGNGGLTGPRMAVYVPLVGDIWGNISPDLVFVHLGTNDYRNSGVSPQSFKAALEAFTSMIRTVAPNCGIVIIVPPQTDGEVVVPLSQYRDVVYQHCVASGCEMVNLLDSWGSYAQDIDLFDSKLHINAAGAAVEVRQLNHHVLGL